MSCEESGHLIDIAKMKTNVRDNDLHGENSCWTTPKTPRDGLIFEI